MEFYWILLKCIGSYWKVLDSYWDYIGILLKCLGFYWKVLAFYWNYIGILLKCIGFYCKVLDFYWICICGGGAQVARGPREARNH